MAQAQAVEHSVSPPGRRITLQEYLEASDRFPVEVVNGEIVVMSPTQRKHSRIAHRLYDSLRESIRAKPPGTVLMEAAYVLDGDRRADWVNGARVPDVSFIAAERVEAHNAEYGPDDGPWWLAPDLAAEIVSPTDKYSEVNQKVTDYLRFGARLVWLIDPQQRAVRVYTPQTPNGALLADSDMLTAAPVLPGWQMAVHDLLDG